MISSVIVLGGGSAGFLAALTLKRKLPALSVRVIRSREIGIIGVGEGTTPAFPRHIHDYLKLPHTSFFAEAQPVWKLGIRYLWGPRTEFDYTFASQWDIQWPGLTRAAGYYAGDGDVLRHASVLSSLMAHDHAFPQAADGSPVLNRSVAYHIENEKLVSWLERVSRAAGVEIHEATVCGVETKDCGGEPGVAALIMEDGGRAEADLFVDCSGFRSELLSRALAEPFVSYGDALFNDRAVAGGRGRLPDEAIQPFTTAETMAAGWCWRIDHEHHVNRGYVYSSAFLSDDEAEREFRALNPHVAQTRLVKFRTGRSARMWVGNVVGAGNASGFVEPLEATALMVLGLQVQALADGLVDTDRAPTASLRGLYNEFITGLWDDVRDFLTIHFKFNTRLATPYWRHCHDHTPLHGAAGMVEFYRENGPSLLPRTVLISPNNPFGLEGYYALLIGQNVPHRLPPAIPPAERAAWERRLRAHAATGAAGVSVPEALAAVRSPRWRWKFAG